MCVAARLADFDDIDALVRVRFDYFSEEGWTLADGERARYEAQFRDYYKRRLNVDFFAAFVESDGRVASTAFLVLSEMPANPSFPTGRIGTILNVLTYPQYRRMGYATQALTLLIAEGKRQNLSYLELSASNMGKPVYEKLGFVARDSSDSRFAQMRLPMLP